MAMKIICFWKTIEPSNLPFVKDYTVNHKCTIKQAAKTSDADFITKAKELRDSKKYDEVVLYSVREVYEPIKF